MKIPLGFWLIVCLLCGLSTTAALADTADTLSRVKQANTLRIGYREDARPFSFRAGEGEPEGYTVDVCRRVAEDVKRQLGLDELTVDYVSVDTDDRFQAVADGRIDILCGATTATLARREQVSFSLPIFITGVSTLLRADAPEILRSVLADNRPTPPHRSLIVQALKRRQFGVRPDTTAETELRAVLKRYAVNAKVVPVDSHQAGLARVRDREIDAYFADRALLIDLVAESGEPDAFIVAQRLFTSETYALAFEYGDERFRLLVDRTLSRLFRSGDIDAIFTPYFGKPSKVVQLLFLISSLPE